MGISRVILGYKHYGNPWQLLAQRLLGNKLNLFNVEDRASGVACWCIPDSHRMFAEVWFYRNYDVPGVPLRPGDVVLDIGANQGFYSCYAAHKGAQVIAFEPDPKHVALLERNLSRNGLSSQVRVRQQAVGAETGTIDFFTSPMIGGGMNTTVASFAAQYGHVHSDPVPCVSLKDVFKEGVFDHVRLCKIDCEGAELEILRNLDSDEIDRIDAFALEYHPTAYKVSDLIKCMLAWETHQVMFAPAIGEAPVALIHAVANRVMHEFAESI
jgi:FkbM family methyltransferase